jgi:arsenate reductase
MAEGFARMLWPGVITAHSAGIVAHGKNPLAVRAMAEAGVDISAQESKTLASLLDAGKGFDLVVTVCSSADGNCPLFPGRTKVIHHGFDDPPALAGDAKSEEEAMIHYRRVRDEIRAFVHTLPTILSEA